jgi:hypothetical protein
MSLEQRQALRRASSALEDSMDSAPQADKARIQEAIDAIQDDLTRVVFTDLLAATQAVRRAADAMEDLLGTVNAHAPQQIKAEVQSALANLRQPSIGA